MRPLLPIIAVASLAAADRPNILVVLTDDHSVPHVGCYGNADIRTPNLDRFAQQGMRFDRAYVACPQCVPSRAAMMTGRSPVGIQMTRFSAALPREIPVYPELLRKAGYFTGVAGRTYHLDGSHNHPPEVEAISDRLHLRTFPDRLDFVKTGPMLPQYREFLDAAPRDRPFYLQLCSTDPHRPLTTKPAKPHDPATLALPAHYPDTPAVRADLAAYYDEIGHFDEEFAEILGELDKRGLAQNTLVLFMGDNGCSQFRGKGTLYEYGIHVPLIVRWPEAVKPGGSYDGLISGEDLAPTLMAAAGVEALPSMTGRSFLGALKGQAQERRRFIFAERGAHGASLPGGSNSFDLSRCIRTETHKLIYNALTQLPYAPVDFQGDAMWKELVAMNAAGKLSAEMSRIYFSPTRPMFELYDLAKDPREFDNLAGKSEAATIEQELKLAMTEWMITERDYLPLPIGGLPRKHDGGKERKGKGE